MVFRPNWRRTRSAGPWRIIFDVTVVRRLWLSQASSSTASEQNGNGVTPDANAMRGAEQKEVSCMGTAMDVTCSYDGGDTGNGAADAAKGHHYSASITLSLIVKLSYHWQRYACDGMNFQKISHR